MQIIEQNRLMQCCASDYDQEEESSFDKFKKLMILHDDQIRDETHVVMQIPFSACIMKATFEMEKGYNDIVARMLKSFHLWENESEKAARTRFAPSMSYEQMFVRQITHEACLEYKADKKIKRLAKIDANPLLNGKSLFTFKPRKTKN